MQVPDASAQERGQIPAAPAAEGNLSSAHKAVILFLLLDRAGLKPRFARVARNTPIRLDPEFPAPAFLNHLIVFLGATTDGDKALWLDPTCEYCALGQIPSTLAGLEAVIFKASGTPQDAVVDVKIAPVTGEVRMNQDLRRYDAVLDGLGNLEVSMENIKTGTYATSIGLELRNITPTAFEEQARKRLAGKLPTAQLKSHTPPKCEATIGRCSQTMQLSVQNYATVEGDRLLVPLTVLEDGWDQRARTAERQLDIVVRHLTHDEEELRLKVPSGYALEGAPAPEIGHSSAVDTTFAVSMEGDVLVVRRTLETNQGSFPRADYPAVHSVFQAYAAERQKVLVLRRSAAAAR
jgi:hypothetical protein